MLTEIDIERIMTPQRLLEETSNTLSYERETGSLLDDDGIVEMLDIEISVSKINGLM